MIATRLIAPLFALTLAACSAIVPSTAARLATLDPLTADPGQIELAVFLPPGLSITPGSARLKLAAVRGEESLTGSFTLEDRAVDAGIEAPDGAIARGYGLTPEDAAAMRALQAQILDWKREGDAQGSLSLGIGGCATGSGPAPDARGTVLIRLAEDGPFLPLIRNGKIADLLGAELLDAIKPCQGAE